MAEFSKPTSYTGRLAYAQRLVKTAQFRSDPKLAVRELCEAIGEIASALLEREQGQPQGDTDTAPKAAPT